MYLNTFINALFLCLLNFCFMVAGAFLNFLVIISLWRSHQLRKKLCYFMILVLSCFDLAVVTITHPVIILTTILWSMQKFTEEVYIIRMNTCLLLGGFAMFALLTLNIERYLALTCPFFHQTAVTKGRLVIFMALLMVIPVALSPFYYFDATRIRDILLTVFLFCILSGFIFLNCRMLVIAKSKREVERIAPMGITTASKQEIKKRTRKSKNISTCSLAVCCFFICFFPEILHSIWRFKTKVAWYDEKAMLLRIWSDTLVTMNSTFNCVIFFWRNSILRREGMKIVKCSGI